MLNRRYLATQFQVSKAESKRNDEAVLERAYDAGYRWAKRQHTEPEPYRLLKDRASDHAKVALMQLDYRTDVEEEGLEYHFRFGYFSFLEEMEALKEAKQEVVSV